MGADVLLQVNGLAKAYKRPLFQNLNITLGAGEGLGIAGNNGSGKTTLLHILAGIVKPDAGTVNISGKLGYVPQKDGLPGSLSCIDVLRLYSRLSGMSAREEKERIAICAEACGINDYLKKRLSLCSSGMRQRVSIAVAMLGSPDIILLDEVFTALDETSRESVRQVLLHLREQGAGIVMVSHLRADFGGLCEKLLHLPDGAVEVL